MFGNNFVLQSSESVSLESFIYEHFLFFVQFKTFKIIYTHAHTYLIIESVPANTFF